MRQRDPLINIFTLTTIVVICRRKWPVIECLCVWQERLGVCAFVSCVRLCTSDLMHQRGVDNSNTDKQLDTIPVGFLLISKSRQSDSSWEAEKWWEKSVKSPCPRVKPTQINICENWCQTVNRCVCVCVCMCVCVSEREREWVSAGTLKKTDSISPFLFKGAVQQKQ